MALGLDVHLEAVLARRLARDRPDRDDARGCAGNRSAPPIASSRNRTVDELVNVT